MKKLLSPVLCLVVILSFVVSAVISASAEAAENETPATVYFEDEIKGYGASAVLPLGAPEEEEALHVPRLVIETEDHVGSDLTKEDGYVDAHIVITDTDGSVLEDDTSFKIRGNSTAFYTIQKKAYTIKFSKKKEVLGMGKGKR